MGMFQLIMAIIRPPRPVSSAKDEVACNIESHVQQLAAEARTRVKRSFNSVAEIAEEAYLLVSKLNGGDKH